MIVFGCSTWMDVSRDWNITSAVYFYLCSLVHASQVKSYGGGARSCFVRDLTGEAARFVVAECGFAAWSDGEPSIILNVGCV